MNLDLNAVAGGSLPRGQWFTALFLGPDAYMGVRPGAAVTLACKDGPVQATAEAVAIGPLLQFFNTGMLGQPQHYAFTTGAVVGAVATADQRAMVDAIEALHPGNAAALDPRTIYTQITLTVPLAVLMPAA